MTTARRPPDLPTAAPTSRSGTYARKPNTDRPLIGKLMDLLKTIKSDSEGKITNRSIAAEIGKTENEVSEHISCKRNAPSGETTLAYLRLCYRHDARATTALLRHE
jgi:hypothetical protein